MIDDEWRVVGIDGKAVIFVCVGLCVCLCEKFPFVSRPIICVLKLHFVFNVTLQGSAATLIR